MYLIPRVEGANFHPVSFWKLNNFDGSSSVAEQTMDRRLSKLHHLQKETGWELAPPTREIKYTYKYLQDLATKKACAPFVVFGIGCLALTLPPSLLLKPV